MVMRVEEQGFTANDEVFYWNIESPLTVPIRLLLLNTSSIDPPPLE